MLLQLKNTKQNLEFIQRFNEGFIKSSWNDIKKDIRVPRGRKGILSEKHVSTVSLEEIDWSHRRSFIYILLLYMN